MITVSRFDMLKDLSFCSKTKFDLIFVNKGMTPGDVVRLFKHLDADDSGSVR